MDCLLLRGSACLGGEPVPNLEVTLLPLPHVLSTVVSLPSEMGMEVCPASPSPLLTACAFSFSTALERLFKKARG